jgi:hypothetical protein
VAFSDAESASESDASKGKGKGQKLALGLSEEAIDSRIAARISGELRFYDGRTHLAISALNKTLRSALKGESRVFTMETPVFIHGSGLNDTKNVDRAGL